MDLTLSAHYSKKRPQKLRVSIKHPVTETVKTVPNIPVCSYEKSEKI